MDTVLTLTMNPTLDIGLEIERLVAGQKLRSPTVRREPGGGINVARGISRLGGTVCALFTGDDVVTSRVET
jgi:6-phosphofructokinase 2